MKVLANDAYPDPAFVEAHNGKYVDLDTLFRESDFITLHAPLTEETRNMVDARRLAEMKPRAVLVNTARGGIVDEDALYQALKRPPWTPPWWSPPAAVPWPLCPTAS